MTTMIVRSPGGSQEKTVPLSDVQVPDAWHAAMQLKDIGRDDLAEIVLDTWYLCHDLLRTLRAD